MKTKNKILGLTGVLLLFLIFGTPIGIYIYYFRRLSVSQNPDNWGVFGDYIGGTLNPLIAIVNLFVLAYLTYLVAKRSNKASKKLFILERKMLAYDELAIIIKDVSSFNDTVRFADSLMTYYETLPPEQRLAGTIKINEIVKELAFTFSKFHFSLEQFRIRYSHIFKYDFDGIDFNSLLSEAEQFGKINEEVLGGISSGKVPSQVPDNFNKFLNKVLNDIRSEVLTN
jgi:hypothetical protein